MSRSEGTYDTRLHEAVRFGDIEEVKISLRQSHDPNLIGLYQWSALHEAAHHGETEILKLLLQHKGNPNNQDHLQSRTAVHYAAEEGNIDCLQLLVDAGGRYDIRDANGKNCLDICTPTGRRILEKLRVRDLMLMSPANARQSVLGQDDTVQQQKDTVNRSATSLSSTSSLESESSSSTHKESSPVLGYLQMSIEHHKAKATMKIRVWQVSDLLLPPANTCMIHTVYVKSYLQPDKSKDTKRKTEEVKVESSEGHIHLKKRKDQGIQHVFTPVSFKFSKALEYTKVSKDMLTSKHLQLELCITQKYSHRSFLIGMLNIPLKVAVKKVVKEKYPLIPCMNHSIPSNMRVYSASEMRIENSTAKVFYSNPNFRLLIPDEVDDDISSERAISNPDLQQSESPLISTQVDMTGLKPDYGVHVPRLKLDALKLDESGYASEFHISFPGELESPDSELPKGDNSSSTHVTTIDLQKKNAGKVKRVIEGVKKTLSPRSKTVSQLKEDVVMEDMESDSPREVKVEGLKNSGVENWKYQNIKKSTKAKSADSSSHPEMLSWDYYDIPTEVIATESGIDDVQTKNVERGLPVMLPMETNMQIRKKGEIVDKRTKTSLATKENENRGKEKDAAPIPKERTKRNSRKKSEPVPGHAVPLVPTIIITNADKMDNQVKQVEITVGTEDNTESGKSTKSSCKQTSSKPLQRNRKNSGKSAGKEKSSTIEIIDFEQMQAKSKTESSTESVAVDMDKVSHHSSDSFIVDMDDLTDRSELFSEMTMRSMMDQDEDLSIQRTFSHTKHVIPMQVFIDDNSDSCDETLPLNSFV